MTDETYNGYPNHQTWCVSLWLDNEEWIYTEIHDVARNSAWSESELGEWLKEYVANLAEDIVPGVLETPSFVSDLFGSALAHVDFRHIAANLLAEVEELV